MAWVKPLDHFGRAYAEVDENQENLNICSNKDGEYNVLLIATRKDKDATQHWKGCVLYTSPSPRDQRGYRMPSSA